MKTLFLPEKSHELYQYITIRRCLAKVTEQVSPANGSAWVVVRESGHILLEGAPGGFDRRAVAEAIIPGLYGVLALVLSFFS